MKTLREMTAAALLACVLTVSVSAGEMSAGYTGSPPPPPPDPPATTNATADGTAETGDVIVDAIATLLSGLMSVL